MRDRGCEEKGDRTPFDAEHAYAELLKKHNQLVDIVAYYFSEAGLEPSLRSANAEILRSLFIPIVGGSTTTEFPECCLIGDDSLRSLRSGVLIHPRVVITAAHEDVEEMTKVGVGGTADFDPRMRWFSRDYVVKHSGYNPPATKYNDIAVIILKGSGSPTPCATIATTEELQAATETTLVGFGFDNILATHGLGIKRAVTVGIDVYSNPSEAESRLGFESDFEFTAGGDDKDTCKGDSGGPAYIDVNGTLKVAGLTSRPYLNASQPCGKGGIYTRVDVHFDFIREIADASGIPFP